MSKEIVRKESIQDYMSDFLLRRQGSYILVNDSPFILGASLTGEQKFYNPFKVTIDNRKAYFACRDAAIFKYPYKHVVSVPSMSKTGDAEYTFNISSVINQFLNNAYRYAHYRGVLAASLGYIGSTLYLVIEDAYKLLVNPNDVFGVEADPTGTGSGGTSGRVLYFRVVSAVKDGSNIRCEVVQQAGIFNWSALTDAPPATGKFKSFVIYPAKPSTILTNVSVDVVAIAGDDTALGEWTLNKLQSGQYTIKRAPNSNHTYPST